MRRLFFSLLATTFAATLVGCYHIAGVCDCEPERDPCLVGASCGVGPNYSNGNGNVSGVPTVTNSLPTPAPSRK